MVPISIPRMMLRRRWFAGALWNDIASAYALAESIGKTVEGMYGISVTRLHFYRINLIFQLAVI